jgi:hypothetical protein
LQQAGSALRFMDGGDTELAERVDDAALGPIDVSDGDVLHSKSPARK